MADAYISSTLLLLHCDGANGSTTFTDNSFLSKTVTPSGNTNVSTAQSKFGGSSAYFDGVGDYLTVSGNTDFSFGTGNFTIEMWVRRDTFTSYAALYSGDATLAQATNLGIRIFNTDGSVIVNVGSTNIMTATAALPLNTWAHLSVVRSSNTFYVFVDGIQIGSTGSYSGSITCSTGYPSIGGHTNYTDFKGYLDDIRITKVARYTSNFTAPTAAFDNYLGVMNYTKSGSILITVTPNSNKEKHIPRRIISGLSIHILPYSTKIYTAHSHFITSNFRIMVIPSSIFVNHAIKNNAIVGSLYVSVVPSSNKLFHTTHHVKSGSTTIIVDPKTPAFIYTQYHGGNAALTIPSLFAYATGWKEEPNAAALVLPSLIGTGVGGGLASGRLPSLLITATGTQELHGTAEAILPGLYFEGIGQREYNGTATLVIPGFNASSYGAATVELILPSFTVAGTGTQEFGGQANCILPGLVMAATGQREYNGTASLVLPGLTGGDIGRAALVIQGLTVSASGSVSFANSVGFVLNVHTNESVQWSNMGFLHIIRIGTDYYGVKSTGLYKLSTAYTTDSGTAINATVTTKSTDFGSYHSKRLQYAYIGSDSSTLIQPIVDGVTKQSHASSFGGRKTLMSKGNVGRYWQVRISNIQELTGLELLPQELQRRVK